MANVISSFLVGIGFDFDKKSAKQVEGGIDSIKSKALQLGAVVAGAYGVKKLATDFADSADMLGKFSEVFGGTAADIQAFGSALETEGGSLESFMSQIESLERARARIKVGDVAFFAPAGKAGLDPNVIANAENATEAYLGLADSFAKMNRQERINAAEALGLSDDSIRLLSQGRESVDLLVEKFRNIRPLTGQMTEDAAKFNRQWIEVKANMGGFADAIGSELLPVINNITESINSWFDEDRLSDLKAIAALTRATFGGGTAEGNAEATGLPEWLFTKSIGETIEATGVNDAAIFNKGTLYDTSNSIYNRPESKVNPSIIENLKANPTMLPSSFFTDKRDQEKENSRNTSTKDNEKSPTINVNATLNLDGQVIDQRTIKVVDGMAQTAIDDIASSTRG